MYSLATQNSFFRATLHGERGGFYWIWSNGLGGTRNAAFMMLTRQPGISYRWFSMLI